MNSIAIVGDIFPQDPLPKNNEMAEVAAVLRSADFAFGNLETPVSERGEAIEKFINMRMPPELLTDVMDMGFQVLTLANNHMMDFGELAFLDTLTHLQERNLTYVGAGVDLETAWEAKILSKGDFRVAFLGGCSTLGPGLAAGENRPGIAPIRITEAYNADPWAGMEQPGSAPYVFTQAWQEDLDRAVAAIDNVPDDVDLVVVAMHWGVPPPWRSRFQDGLSDYQIEVGHALIDAGADVIIGHHPHSLQEIEIYEDAPIFYSLGNFVFHQNKGPVQETAVIRNLPYSLNIEGRDRIWSETVIVIADIDDEGEVNYRMQPVLLDEAGNPSLLKGVDARALIERLAAMSPNADIGYRDGLGHLLFS